ncbi:MAG: GIY-YIG nuclease family protein [Actinomycetota bacterium]
MDSRLRNCRDDDVINALNELDLHPRIVEAAQFPCDLSGLHEAGLYSWWVDDEGADELSTGLGILVDPGRIYAGQAGATKWPSATRSAATLGSRISTQHLGGNIYGSTFRLTLASALRSAMDLTPIGPKRLSPGDEERLSAWIRSHLSVAVFGYPSRDALEDLEHRVLGRLDPPLNLRGMSPTPLRARLNALRARLYAGSVQEGDRSGGGEHSNGPVGTETGPRSVTLHVEIADILRERRNHWMTTQELADAVNARGRYSKRDGSAVTAFQIHGRTRNYGQLFDRDGSAVRLHQT